MNRALFLYKKICLNFKTAAFVSCGFGKCHIDILFINRKLNNSTMFLSDINIIQNLNILYDLATSNIILKHEDLINYKLEAE